MFCPNCGKENRADQKFCRSCGLKLDAISQVVADQFPSEEYADLQRRKQIFEILGLSALSIAVLIGLMLLLFKVAYYKLILLGPELLFSSAIGALIVFLLLSVFFFNYPTFFMRFEKVDPQRSPPEESLDPGPTNKLIEDRPFEPVPSVTEDSTDLLPRERTRLRR